MGRERRVHHADIGGSGAEILLDADQSHHLARVLRLVAGDELSVFDGRGREWHAVVVELSGGGMRVRVGEEMTDRVESELRVELYQALCRPERIDWLVQKATEVGLSTVHLFPAVRTGHRQVSGQRLERWRRIAREASKQCGRRRIPTVEIRNDLPEVQGDVLGLALDAGTGAPPLGEHLREGRRKGVWLAVGPEGGFSKAELEGLERSGWVRAGLGPRTLRTETAGMVAGAIVLHRWSDLGGS